MKSQFRFIKPLTIRKYRRPLMAALALLIRFLALRRSGMVDGLGKLDIVCSTNQTETAQALLDVFIETKGKPPLPELYRLMHAALDAILRPSEDLPEQTLACPTDYALFLISLVDRDQWMIAAHLGSEAAAVQWCLRAVFIQSMRLLAKNESTSYRGPESIDALVDSDDTDVYDDDGDTDVSDDDGDTNPIMLVMPEKEDDEVPSDLEGDEDDPESLQHSAATHSIGSSEDADVQSRAISTGDQSLSE
jgi:hypothetical protein